MEIQQLEVATLPALQQQQSSPAKMLAGHFIAEAAPTHAGGGPYLATGSQLREEEERHRSLLSNLPCVVYRCATDEFWTAEFVSEGSAQITGYPAADFLSNQKRSLASLVAPEDRNRIQKEINQAVAHGQAYLLEYRIIHADGSECWVADRGRVVAEKTGFVQRRDGALFDTSDQKQTEAMLAKVNRELLEHTRLTGEFLANISHEIRTPLSVILTIAESLQEGIYGITTPRQGEALGRLRRSGRHLLGLVNNILDMAKMEAGKLKLHMQRTAVEALCTHSLQMMQDLAQGKKIKLQYVNRTDAAILWGDEQRLHQILVNLLTNAIKFTPEGGEVGIEVTTNPQDEVIHFTVWDTGIGIAKEDTVKVFRPFVQLDTTLSRQYEGTGLGLALVYHLTRLHEGGLRLESTEGKGSRFTISLPWRATVATTPISSTAAIAAGADHAPKKCVLLLEQDEAENHKLITALKAHHIDVMIISSDSAISLADEEQPDLILIDAAIPDFRTVETVRQLRALQPFATVPIVAMTTLTVSGHQDLWQQAGIHTCLPKPVSLRQLIALIQNNRKS